MSDKLRCEIVQDLLPSYVDGLTSDETNEAIKDHLADCVSCRDMYERMKADETSAEENSEVMEKEKKEINFLKKIKQASVESDAGGSDSDSLFCSGLLSSDLSEGGRNVGG